MHEYTVASPPCWIPIITILLGPFAADFLLHDTLSSHINLTFLSRYLHLRDNRNFLKKFRHRYFYNCTSLSVRTIKHVQQIVYRMYNCLYVCLVDVSALKHSYNPSHFHLYRWYDFFMFFLKDYTFFNMYIFLLKLRNVKLRDLKKSKFVYKKITLLMCMYVCMWIWC